MWELASLGDEIAKQLQPGDTLLLKGEMGAGKTTLAKEIIHRLTGVDKEEITSPTFSYVHEYEHVYHFDLYRLPTPQEFEARGFEEYFTPHAVCIIEWPEKAEGFLPTKVKTLRITQNQGERRYILDESSLH